MFLFVFMRRGGDVGMPGFEGMLGEALVIYLSFTGDRDPPLTPVGTDVVRHCLLCVLFWHPVKHLQHPSNTCNT